MPLMLSPLWIAAASTTSMTPSSFSCPIRLTHCLWVTTALLASSTTLEIFSKALANRFAPVLPLQVSPNQSAFIKGRQIQDSFRCVLGMAKALAAKRNPRVMLKIDLAKAFDSVGWVFLLDLLSVIGCPRTWTKWISTILSTTSTKVLLNGSPSRRICHGRGLRQGGSAVTYALCVSHGVL
jgi:hypothetical protein